MIFVTVVTANRHTTTTNFTQEAVVWGGSPNGLGKGGYCIILLYHRMESKVMDIWIRYIIYSCISVEIDGHGIVQDHLMFKVSSKLVYSLPYSSEVCIDSCRLSRIY